MSLKAKIEAVLYMTDKPLRAQAIAGIVGEDLQAVRQTLLDLIHDYEERQGGLEIADEDGYSVQVRDQYANLMDQFMPIEMTAALLRTLSAIAIKQPIPQSEIIRIRGAGAYEHIKELVTKGLVSKREDEKTRSPLLSTTKQFQEYFRLTKDGKSLRQFLKKEMRKKDREEIFPNSDSSSTESLNSALPADDILSFVPADKSASPNVLEEEHLGSIANAELSNGVEGASIELDTSTSISEASVVLNQDSITPINLIDMTPESVNQAEIKQSRKGRHSSENELSVPGPMPSSPVPVDSSSSPESLS